MTATASISAAAFWKSSQPPATRLMPSLCSIAPTACFLPATPTTPGPFGSLGLKPISVPTRLPFVVWPRSAPQVKVIMGAHNIPVASPTVLPRLVTAFDVVRAGKVQPSPDSPGKVLYKVDDISFLMRAPAAH